MHFLASGNSLLGRSAAKMTCNSALWQPKQASKLFVQVYSYQLLMQVEQNDSGDTQSFTEEQKESFGESNTITYIYLTYCKLLSVSNKIHIASWIFKILLSCIEIITSQPMEEW